MACPICGQRKGRRACPALGQQICAVCCGTKRIVEIRCPEDCGYLAAARQHPPAVVQRQHDRDIEALRPTLSALTETQQQICFLLLSIVSSHAAVETLDRVLDADVADAAATLASTYETAAKGVIYEHTARSLPAQRLVTSLRGLVEQLSRSVQAGTMERDVSSALRGIERGVREVERLGGGQPRAYLESVERLIRPFEAATAAPEQRSSGLIVPPA
jgi:hypothetical protein